MTIGVTIGATLGVTIGVEAIVVTRVTFGVTITKVAFGVKSVTLKVADGVSIGAQAMAVFAVTVGVSIGEKNRTRFKIIKKLTMKKKCRIPCGPLHYVIMKFNLQCMNRWHRLTCIGNYKIISVFPTRLGSKKLDRLMVRYGKVLLKSVCLERRLVFDPNGATSKQTTVRNKLL